MAVQTWLPPYSTRAISYVPRGGNQLLDIDSVTAGALVNEETFALLRDAHGGPLMVRGTDRLISRIVRAIGTARGSFWGDPSYGSDDIPGVSFTRNVPIHILSCVMSEIARYAVSRPLSPGDRIGQVRVTAVSLASDARTVLVNIVLYDGGGNAFPAQIAF